MKEEFLDYITTYSFTTSPWRESPFTVSRRMDKGEHPPSLLKNDSLGFPFKFSLRRKKLRFHPGLWVHIVSLCRSGWPSGCWKDFTKIANDCLNRCEGDGVSVHQTSSATVHRIVWSFFIGERFLRHCFLSWIMKYKLAWKAYQKRMFLICFQTDSIRTDKSKIVT